MASYGAYAADFSDTTVAADGTQDVDITAPVSIDTAVTLTLDGSTNGNAIAINGTIDSSLGDIGIISTVGNGTTITQNSAIGSISAIDGITIGETDTWIANADIITDVDSSINAVATGDIDLGDATTGTTLQLNNGITVSADIHGNNGDIVEIGADGNGGEFTLTHSIQDVRVIVTSGTTTAQTRLGNLREISELNVGEGATLTLSDGALVNTLSVDGTLNIGATNTVTVSSAYTDNGNSGNFNLFVTNSSSGVSSGRLLFNGGDDIDLSDDQIDFIIARGATVIGEGVQTINNVLTTSSATPLVVPTAEVDSSFLYDIDLVNDGTDYNLQIERRDLGEATDTPNNLLMSEALLNDLAVSEDDAILDIQYQLANTPTREDYNEIIESLQPAADSSISMVTAHVNDQARTMVQSRLHAIRNSRKINQASKLITERTYTDNLIAMNEIEPASGSDKNISGYVVPNKTRKLAMQRYRHLHSSDAEQAQSSFDSDNAVNSEALPHFVENKTRKLAQKRLEFLRTRYATKDRDLSHQYRIAQMRDLSSHDENYKYNDHHPQVWAQAFATDGTQHDRDNINGYNFDASGLTVGVDIETDTRKTLYGAYLTYADSNINSGNANLTKSDIEHYMAGVYGSYRFDNDDFLNVVASISTNDIGLTRYNVGHAGYNANAQYDSGYTSIFTEYGTFFDYDNGLSISPSFGMQYSRMSFEDYRERGALGANLTVQQNSITRLDLGPSMTATMHRTFENGVSFIPELYAGYTYNILNDKVTQRAALQAGLDNEIDTEFTYSGFDTQNNFLNLGAGINFAADNWKLLSYYNFHWKEDFDAHTASLKLNYEL